MVAQFHIYTCARSSDINILQRDLTRSPAIANGKVALTILWNQANAAGAYARAMETATAEILIFTHCDVYFPENWFERLAWEVDRLAAMDRDWAVAGVSSMTPSGELVGRMWDASLEPLSPKTLGVFGCLLTTPVPIVSLDEVVIVVRREAGILFDPRLPGFHLYGTDIVLEAERRGKHSYGLDMPILHNAKPQLHIGRDYVQCYRYMVRKWWDRLPLKTPCITLSSNPFTLQLRRLRIRYKALCRPSTYSTNRDLDPRAKATELGFEQLLNAPMAEASLSSSS
jgi:hypothetical protein